VSDETLTHGDETLTDPGAGEPPAGAAGKGTAIFAVDNAVFSVGLR
jgi:hypothetical protein